MADDPHDSRQGLLARLRNHLTRSDIAADLELERLPEDDPNARLPVRQRGLAQDVETFKAVYRGYLENPDAAGREDRYLQVVDAGQKLSETQQRRAEMEVGEALLGDETQHQAEIDAENIAAYVGLYRSYVATDQHTNEFATVDRELLAAAGARLTPELMQEARELLAKEDLAVPPTEPAERVPANPDPPRPETIRRTYTNGGRQNDYTIRPLADGRWALEVESSTEQEHDIAYYREFDTKRVALGQIEAMVDEAGPGWGLTADRAYVDPTPPQAQTPADVALSAQLDPATNTVTGQSTSYCYTRGYLDGQASEEINLVVMPLTDGQWSLQVDAYIHQGAPPERMALETFPTEQAAEDARRAHAAEAVDDGFAHTDTHRRIHYADGSRVEAVLHHVRDASDAYETSYVSVLGNDPTNSPAQLLRYEFTRAGEADAFAAGFASEVRRHPPVWERWSRADVPTLIARSPQEQIAEQMIADDDGTGDLGEGPPDRAGNDATADHAAGRVDYAAGTVDPARWSSSHAYRDGLTAQWFADNDENAQARVQAAVRSSATLPPEGAEQVPLRKTSRYSYVREDVERAYTVRPVAGGRWAVEVEQTTSHEHGTDTTVLARSEHDYAVDAMEQRTAMLREATQLDSWVRQPDQLYIDDSDPVASLDTAALTMRAGIHPGDVRDAIDRGDVEVDTDDSGGTTLTYPDGSQVGIQVTDQYDDNGDYDSTAVGVKVTGPTGRETTNSVSFGEFDTPAEAWAQAQTFQSIATVRPPYGQAATSPEDLRHVESAGDEPVEAREAETERPRYYRSTAEHPFGGRDHEPSADDLMPEHYPEHDERIAAGTPDAHGITSEHVTPYGIEVAEDPSPAATEDSGAEAGGASSPVEHEAIEAAQSDSTAKTADSWATGQPARLSRQERCAREMTVAAADPQAREDYDHSRARAQEDDSLCDE